MPGAGSTSPAESTEDTITVPLVEAGNPFGPKPTEAVGVIAAPVDTLVAVSALGVIAIEIVPPTGVLALTSHASESVAEEPAVTMSGAASVKVRVPPLGVAELERLALVFTAPRMRQFETLPATTPFPRLMATGMEVIEIALFEFSAPTMMLARATLVDPAGTLGAVLRLTSSPGARTDVPAVTWNEVPEGVLVAISQRSEYVCVPVVEGTLTTELNANAFTPETGLTAPLTTVPPELKIRQLVRLEIEPAPLALNVIGRTDIEAVPVVPASWTLASVTPEPVVSAPAIGVMVTFTLPCWTMD